MDCAQVRQDLEAVLDNAVDETRRHSIELHLASCDSCGSRLDHLRSLGRVLRENSTIAVPASLDRRVLTSFNARHIHAETRVSKWRKILLHSVRLPAPVFGLFLLMAIGAVAVSYWVGKHNATSIVLAAPSTPTQVENAIDRVKHIDLKPDYPQIAIATRKKSPSKRATTSAPDKAGAQPLRSSTTINADSANYYTVASLKDFEPLPNATARIIKGGQDK
jgi:predicted anti-sigma-YlaC factor YlaD